MKAFCIHEVLEKPQQQLNTFTDPTIRHKLMQIKHFLENVQDNKKQ